MKNLAEQMADIESHIRKIITIDYVMYGEKKIEGPTQLIGVMPFDHVATMDGRTYNINDYDPSGKKIKIEKPFIQGISFLQHFLAIQKIHNENGDVIFHNPSINDDFNLKDQYSPTNELRDSCFSPEIKKDFFDPKLKNLEITPKQYQMLIQPETECNYGWNLALVSEANGLYQIIKEGLEEQKELERIAEELGNISFTDPFEMPKQSNSYHPVSNKAIESFIDSGIGSSGPKVWTSFVKGLKERIDYLKN